MAETIVVIESITPNVAISISNDQGPQGPTGSTGVANVVSPITNSGTSSAAVIGINQSLLSIANTQVTGLGTASTKDVPASGNASTTQVVYGTDTRLSDSRTPTTHASTHTSGGSDQLTLAQSQVTNLTTDLASKVSTTRNINVASPLSGGGDLSVDRTIIIADATIATKGAVQLTDSVTSTSTITAATPNSVKSAYDLASAANTTASAAVPATRTINTTAPLAGGGLLNSNVTLSISDSSTTQKGAVQLTDSIASISTTTAATPNSVKQAYDLANAAAPKTITISTTAPLAGGGDLSTNRTLSIASASTTTIGAVQLTDSISSTSITTAATPNSVKTTYDLANGKASLSNNNPAALGTVSAGTGTAASRDDHVHSNVGVTLSLPLIDNPKYGATFTATAGATTTLTVASNNQQYFTGTLNQTVVLPVVSTLALGMRYKIINQSTGVITVQSSGLNTITTVASGSFAMVSVVSITGTGTSSWYLDASGSSSVAIGSVTGMGTGVSTFLTTPSSANLASAVTDETGSGALVFGTSPTIATPALTLSSTSSTTAGRVAWDNTAFQFDIGDGSTIRTITADNAAATLTNKTLTFPIIDNIRIGYATTVTSASAVTLTATSGQKQYFTGSTAQTVILPVVSTLALGVSYEINNNSTATITVQSSGLNNIATIPAGMAATFTVILITGTTAASWDFEYSGFNTVTGTGSVVLSASPTFTGTVTTPISSITSYQKYAVAALTTPITANSYSVLDTDTYIVLNRNAGITVTLPTASSYTGRMLHLKNISTGTMVSNASNVIPIAGGAAATTLFSANTAGKFTILVSDGTNWVIMAQN